MPENIKSNKKIVSGSTKNESKNGLNKIKKSNPLITKTPGLIVIAVILIFIIISAYYIIRRPQIDEKSRMETVRLLINENKKQEALDFARQQLILEPEQLELLDFYSDTAPADDVLKLLKIHLDKRPVLINWHRFYQGIFEDLYNDANALINEYKTYLEKEPDNGILLYLSGRIAQTRVEADFYFKRSVEVDVPCAYGYHALAWSRFNSGEFEKAFVLSGEALKLDPGNSLFAILYNGELMALNKYDLLLERIEKKIKKEGLTDTLVQKLISALTLGGKLDEADRVINDFYKLKYKENAESGEAWKSFLQSKKAYLSRDVKNFIKHAADFNGYQFDRAIMENRLSDASKVLEMPDASPFDHLLIAGIANMQKNVNIARFELNRAVRMLKNNTKNNRELKGFLENPTNIKDLMTLEFPPYSKRILAFYLGSASDDPEIRNNYFEIADILNFEKNPPYLAIEQYIRY